jgi:ABC-type multidrug transport system ATPase subunit
MSDVDTDTDDIHYEPLQAFDVAKRYADVVALHELTFEVKAGELVALMGANGAGKSTFLRLAAGLLEPSGGEILVDGYLAGSLEARGLLSYISDQPVLYNDLSVNEHIEYTARLHDLPGWPPLADELLAAFNLAGRADDLPSRFSRGLRQKTSLLLGLIRPFSVLVVDEPFVGLDPAGQGALTDLLEGAAEAGAAVLTATHQLAFLEHASRCLALRDGEVAYSGPVDLDQIGHILDDAAHD